MLDSVIHKHLDTLDSIEEKVIKEIDDFISGVDIDVLLEDPREALTNIVEYIQEEILNKKALEITELGKKFAVDVKKDGNIKIDKSDDPTENKDLLNA